MQAMQLLASSGVTMAAGAMISLSFALSPTPALLLPRPVPVEAGGQMTSQQQRTSETVGAAIADTFERRWQAATDEIPPTPVPLRDSLEGLIGGLPALPLAQNEPQVAHVEPRDPLEGLIGGLPMLTQDASQVMHAEPRNLADDPQPEQQDSVTAVTPASLSDVCVRHGLRRVDYTQKNHHYWRCADRH